MIRRTDEERRALRAATPTAQEGSAAAPTAAVDVRSSVKLLLSFKLERCCAQPLFFLPALELDFFAEADVAQHVAHKDLAIVPLDAHEELAEVADLRPCRRRPSHFRGPA
jgi:hypothetical protein